MQKRRSINHRIIASSHHHIHIHAWTTLKIMTSKNDSKDDCTKRNHFSSPTSVAFVSPTLVPESIVLNPIVLESGANAKRSQQSSWGICPPSAKSVRTVNPIRAIVDAKIQTGEERGDGKDPISLAVRTTQTYSSSFLVSSLPHGTIISLSLSLYFTGTAGGSNGRGKPGAVSRRPAGRLPSRARIGPLCGLRERVWDDRSPPGRGGLSFFRPWYPISPSCICNHCQWLQRCPRVGLDGTARR